MLQGEHDFIMVRVLQKLSEADIATISLDAWKDAQVRSLYLGQAILPNRVAYVILARDMSSEVQDAETLKGALATVLGNYLACLHHVLLMHCPPLQ